MAEIKKNVILFGRPIKTAGISGPTLRQIIEISKDFDEVFGKGSASKMLKLWAGVESRKHLTEEQGQKVFGRLIALLQYAQEMDL